MARLAEACRINVSDRFAFGLHAIVAAGAGAVYLCVIYFYDGRKACFAVAQFAGIVASDMGGGFAFCDGAVVASETGTNNLCVVDLGRGFKQNRVMAGFAGVGTVYM